MNTHAAIGRSRSPAERDALERRPARLRENESGPRTLDSDPVQQGLPLARLSALGDAITNRIRTRPLESLAFAIAAGFLAGGALTFRAGRIALTVAARHAAREVLKQVV